MADQNTLTADEQSFFDTGELPANLAAEQAANEAAINAAAQTQADDAALQQPVVQQPAEQQPIQQPVNDIEFLRQALLQEQRTRAQLEAQIAQAQPKTVEPAAPDPEVDPLGAMMHQLNSVNKTVVELQTKLTEQRQMQEQAEQLISFQSSMKAVRDQFAVATPDFDAAYKHLREVRADDMRTVGVPDAKIQQILLQDEIAIAQNALQSGKNPAEVMYNMAKRHGYTPTAVKPAANIESKISNLKAGLEAAKNVGGAPQPAENLTMAGLKTATDDDLNKLVQSDDAWAKLTGTGGKSIF